jgi:hypothetical protein
MDPYRPPSQIETQEPLKRGPLWLLLVVPPLLLLVINLVIRAGSFKGQYGEGFLNALPGLLALIVCQIFFSRLIGRRYRGKSLVLLSLAYFVGEFVIGLAVWFGSCLLFMN